MNSHLRCLRPYFRSRVLPTSRAACATYLQVYRAVRTYSAKQTLDHLVDRIRSVTPEGTNTPEPRIRVRSGAPEEKYVTELYPRITPQKGVIDYHSFRERYQDIKRGDSRPEELIVRGMSCYA